MKEFIGRLVASILLVAFCFFGTMFCMQLATQKPKVATPTDATITDATATDADATITDAATATATDADAEISIEKATATDVTAQSSIKCKSDKEILDDRAYCGIKDTYKRKYNKVTTYNIEKQDDAYYVSSLSGTVTWYAPIVDLTKYANTEVYLRKAPHMDAQPEIITGVNEELNVVGLSENGWDIVSAYGDVYFAWAGCLSEEPVKVETVQSAPAPQVQTPAVPASNGNMTYVGYYELTAYEETGYCCANGNYPTLGYTVACNSIPLGTRIYIEGYGEYTVEDRGGMGGNVVDIYLGDPYACKLFGRQGANIYIIN